MHKGIINRVLHFTDTFIFYCSLFYRNIAITFNTENSIILESTTKMIANVEWDAIV